MIRPTNPGRRVSSLTPRLSARLERMPTVMQSKIRVMTKKGDIFLSLKRFFQATKVRRKRKKNVERRR